MATSLQITKLTTAVVTAAVAAAALALPFTAAREGMVLHGYPDPARGAALPTECAGHTGPEVKIGQARTLDYCLQTLARDAVKYGLAIAPCLPAELPPPVRAAFTDVAYNLGSAKFCASSMARLAQAGDLHGACKAIELYVYAGGRDCRLKGSKCPGLPIWRAKERAFCEGGL